MSEKRFLPDIIDTNKPGEVFKISNFELVKEELGKLLSDYKDFQITNNIAEAKELRAGLNNMAGALNQKKIAVKKAYLEPYEYGETQIKELIGMISNVSLAIDKQVKDYEENKKKAKKADIEALFKTFVNPRKIGFDRVFNEKWLNATVTLKAVEKDLTNYFENVESNIATIETLYTDEVRKADAIALFVDYLDFGRAIQEEKRIWEFNNRPKPTPIVVVANPAQVTAPVVEEEAKNQPSAEEVPQDYLLSITGTRNQLLGLKEYLKAHGIAYNFERR